MNEREDEISMATVNQLPKNDEQLKIIQGASTILNGHLKPTRCSWDASSSLTRMRESDG